MLIIQKILNWFSSPKFLEVMSGRYGRLQNTIEGLKQSGLPLIGYKDSFIKAEDAEDIGLYYFVPKIVNFFGLTLDQGLTFFLGSLIFVAYTLGLIGFFLTYKDVRPRLVSLIGLSLLALITICIWDVYVSFFFITVSVIPLFLFFVSKGVSNLKFWIPAMLTTGIIVGVANIIRSHSGTGVLIFLLFALLLKLKENKKNVLLILTVLFVGFLVPKIHINHLIEQRDTFLQENSGIKTERMESHVFWGAVYGGLSFLDNDLGLKWDDRVVVAKAREVNPDVPLFGQEYEEIMKNETLKIVKNHTGFFIKSFVAKTGFILMYFVLFVNLGLFFIWKTPKAWTFYVPFFFSISFYGLPGLLVIPHPDYLLGFISVCTILGILSINHGLQKAKA